MTSSTQGLVAAVLAAVILRISLTGEYLNFVQPWMRWPLLLTSVALLLMALRPALGFGPQGGPVPRTSWLLLLPALSSYSLSHRHRWVPSSPSDTPLEPRPLEPQPHCLLPSGSRSAPMVSHSISQWRSSPGAPRSLMT